MPSCIPGAIYHIQYNTSRSRNLIQTNEDAVLLRESLEEEYISIAITPESELGPGPTWTGTVGPPIDRFPKNYCAQDRMIGPSAPESS